MLEVRNLSVSFGKTDIVKDISFSLEEQQWLMIVGPNGAGKSTIINAISQGVAYKGTVLLDGEDVSKCRVSELAKKMGVLTQHHNVGYSFTVEEVVRLGRYAYSGGLFGNGGKDDEQMVNEALELTGLSELRGQSVLTLSGGELQRTFLAQLFAQDPRLLVLDEPTNHLDLIYQRQVFDLVSEWMKKPGRAVISVVHDLSLARAYGTRAILMDGGRILADGSIGEVFKRDNLEKAYDMDVYGWMSRMLSQWK